MNLSIKTAARPFRRLAAATALAALLLTGLGATAHAQDPVTFPAGDFVIDQSNVLTPTDQAALEEKLHSLQTTAGKALFVVFVDEFTNPTEPQKWLKATADRTGLGTTDSMLVIGVKSRKAHFESHSRGSLARYDEKIFSSYVRPSLAEGDWAGAGMAAAEGVEAAALGTLIKSGNSPSGTPRAPREPIDVPWTGILIFIGGAGVLGGGTWAFFWYRGSSIRQRRLNWARIPELRAAASGAVIELDTALTTAEQDLQFASAQFGASPVASQEKQLSHLKEGLSAIFATQAKLNSVEPGTKDEQFAGYEDIVRACKESMALIARQKQAFTLLGERQADLPRVIAAFKQQLAAEERTLENLERDLLPRLEAFERGPVAGILEALRDSRSGAVAGAQDLAKIESMASTQAGLAAGMTPQLEQHLDHAVASREIAQSRWKSLCGKADAVRALDVEIKELHAAARGFGAKTRYRHLLSLVEESELLLRALPVRQLQDPASRLTELKSATRDLERGYREARSTEAAIQKANRDMPGAVADARSIIEYAETYINGHRRDISPSVLSLLSSAQGMLAAALAASGGEDQRQVLEHVRAAEEAGRKASKNAYVEASRAEDRRRRARESQMRSSSYSSGSSSSFGSSFSSGFGSGGSGGSFGGGSGGSGGSF